jgi:transketolase
VYASRAEAFGWRAIEIDGHDVEAIDEAFEQATAADGQPVVIVARTLKGKGVAAIENTNGWHGKPLANAAEAIAELGGVRNLQVRPQAPPANGRPHRFEQSQAEPAAWEVGEKVATRRAYGDALVALGARDGRVVALDGEVGNSTYSELFANAHPDRFFEMFIAEQQMVAAAVGMQVRGWRPFASTFAAFLARAYDFTRMAAISQADMCLAGSHAGVSIGEDGPSQMALEDLASFRAVHGSTVLYPSCANQTARLVEQIADLDGIVYLRTTREATPVLYPADEPFPVGGARVARSSDSDDVTIVGAGITLHEALAAADALADEGVSARVVDLYSVKPVDAATITEAAEATGNVLVVEDHWPEGGLHDAVLEVLAEAGSSATVRGLAPTGMPTSGTPAQLLDQAGIDRGHIASAARSLVGVKR